MQGGEVERPRKANRARDFYFGHRISTVLIDSSLKPKILAPALLPTYADIGLLMQVIRCFGSRILLVRSRSLSTASAFYCFAYTASTSSLPVELFWATNP